MAESTPFQQCIERGLAASAASLADEAVAWFRRAAKAEPSSAVPHFLIASEHATLGQVEAAEQAFSNAVLLAPDLHVARYQLGLLQFSSGRTALALVTWQPLLSLADEDALPHFVRGFAALAQDHAEQALAHWEQGLPLCSAHPAMAQDVRKVMDAVRTLSVAEPSADSASHLLVAAYAKSLH